jgi:plastocyanin
MKHVPVTFTLNAAKTLDVDPPRPTVHPGDTIAWTCPDGAITVSFDTSVVFESGSKFHAAKGGQTEKGKIRADAPLGQFFKCHVTFNGQPMEVPYGFDTSGSGG